MKSKSLRALGLAIFLSAHAAFAVTPENGWWWNPAEPGRGFNIETQNNTVFVATYVYDTAGNPIWYSGSGELAENSTLTVHLLISEEGPCIGCPYHAPTTTDAGIPMTLQFTSSGKGSVLWQGETVPIRRFNFKLGKGAAKLLGEWVLIAQKPGNVGNYLGEEPSNDYYGDRVTFSMITNGQVSGSRTHEPNHKAAGGRTDNLPGFTYYFSLELPDKLHIFKRTGIVRRVGTIRGFAFNFKGLNKIEGLVSEVPASTISLPLLWFEVIHNGKSFEGYRVQ